MAEKQFKAESKRLLDLMINSIYTHKEIFLRELISNASDATDKLYYKALTENISEINKSDLTIDLAFDKENRTLTVTDHGIGMNKEELEEHLGTIANSGSFKFKNETESDDIDIIGQFGVGFYSAFMVAKKLKFHQELMVVIKDILGYLKQVMVMKSLKQITYQQEQQLNFI